MPTQRSITPSTITAWRLNGCMTSGITSSSTSARPTPLGCATCKRRRNFGSCCVAYELAINGWRELDDVIEVVQGIPLDGIIATNTTLRRRGLSTGTTEAGGLSGRPLRQES